MAACCQFASGAVAGAAKEIDFPAAHWIFAGVYVLELIGIDESAERVYRTILSHRRLSCDALTGLTGLDDQTVRAALASLEARELVHSTADGYTAAPPDNRVLALLLAEQVELLRRGAELDDLHGRLAELVVDHRIGVLRWAGFDGTEFVPGDDARAYLTEAARKATSEVVCVHQTPYAAFAGSDEPDGMDVSFRAIYAPEWLGLPGAMDRVRSYVSLGRQVRTLSHPPVSLVIVDREAALLPRAVFEPGHDGLLVLRSAALVEALHDLFEWLWSRSSPLTFELPPTDEDVPPLPPELVALVPLLAAGLQDQAIARQLGIGLRTVRRRMQLLMNLTGARTRLQVGIAIARRGWV